MAPGRAGGLVGGIGAPGRDSSGLGGIVVSRRDLVGLGGIVASGRVGGTRLLTCILRSNGCNAILFLDLAVLALHVSQVARTLLPGLEASLRNEDSRRFCRHEEQYLESISDVKVEEL